VWPNTKLVTKIGSASSSKDASLTLFGASVFGNVEMRGATLGKMLNLSNAEIRGNLILQALDEIPTQIGCAGQDRESIRLVGTRVGGRMELHGVLLEGGLNLTNAHVGGFEIDRETRRCLANQNSGSISDNDTISGLRLSGWTFGSLTIQPETVPQTSFQRFTSWLFPTRENTLLANSYVQFLEPMREVDETVYNNLEKWLRSHGKDEDADQVFFRMRSRELQGVKGFFRRRLKFVLLHFLGYGLRIHWLVFIWTVTFLLTFSVFLDPHSVERPQSFVAGRFDEARTSRFQWPVPVRPSTLSSRWDDDGSQPEGWTGFDSGWMSLRSQIPVVQIFARNDWEPACRVIRHPWNFFNFQYDSYSTMVTLLNWMVVPLIIASATGLLKKRSS